jgi:molybdopterin-containing oxidoreductase family iron-sulfur binding subunit
LKKFTSVAMSLKEDETVISTIAAPVPHYLESWVI